MVLIDIKFYCIQNRPVFCNNLHLPPPFIIRRDSLGAVSPENRIFNDKGYFKGLFILVIPDVFYSMPSRFSDYPGKAVEFSHMGRKVFSNSCRSKILYAGGNNSRVYGHVCQTSNHL